MTAATMPFADYSGGAPWRPLTVLVLLVFAAHVLVLQASPSRMALQPNQQTVQVFTTRSMAAPPAVQPARLATATPTAMPAPIQQKSVLIKPLQQQVREVSAIDFVANSSLDHTAPENTVPPGAPSASTPVASSPGAADAIALAPAVPAAAAPQPDLAPPVSTAAASAPPRPTVVTAINLPGSAKLYYKVVGTSKGLSYFADAELNWRNTGNQYDAIMKVSALFVGSRSMTSSGAVTATGLAPTRFADKYKSEQAAHFDADKGQVSFSANTPDVPWMEGAQDRVSVFLQLGGVLAAGPGGPAGPAGFAVGSNITFYTVGPRDADTWTFVVGATEQLSLPSGDMATLKLTRQPKREYDQTVEVWYAPSLGYLPVRNRITQANGDFVDQQLKAIAPP